MHFLTPNQQCQGTEGNLAQLSELTGVDGIMCGSAVGANIDSVVVLVACDVICQVRQLRQLMLVSIRPNVTVT